MGTPADGTGELRPGFVWTAPLFTMTGCRELRSLLVSGAASGAESLVLMGAPADSSVPEEDADSGSGRGDAWRDRAFLQMLNKEVSLPFFLT